METPTERIDRWIKEEGQGNTRDALNVALCRLDRLEEDNKLLNDFIGDLKDAADEIKSSREIAYEEGTWETEQEKGIHHVECECNLCTYGREALPANEY